MSDVTDSTPKEREAGLASRLGYYLFAVALFFGANVAYRLNGPAFDILAGLVFAAFVYEAAGIFKKLLAKHDEVVQQLLMYRKAQYKMSNLFKGYGIWYWVIPIIALPFLLYLSDFPIELIRFGSSFLAGYSGLFFVEIYRTLSFYKRMDGYILWDLLQKDSSG